MQAAMRRVVAVMAAIGLLISVGLILAWTILNLRNYQPVLLYELMTYVTDFFWPTSFMLMATYKPDGVPVGVGTYIVYSAVILSNVLYYALLGLIRSFGAPFWAIAAIMSLVYLLLQRL